MVLRGGYIGKSRGSFTSKSGGPNEPPDLKKKIYIYIKYFFINLITLKNIFAQSYTP